MNLNHLVYLQAINKYGSMNKAAKALFVTQPTLTKAIQSMEKEFGCPVIQRTATGIALNDFGKIILQDSQIILNYVENWHKIASNQSIAAPVLIHLTGSAPRFELLKNILQIKKEHPNMDIQIRNALTDDNRTPISNPPPRITVQYNVPEHMDRAIQYARANSLRLAVINEDEFVLVLNKNNPLAQKESLSFDDLKNYEVMLYQTPISFPYYSKVEPLNCSEGLQIWQEENLLISIILNDKAIAIRPKSTLEHGFNLGLDAITCKKFDNISMPINLCMFYPTRDRITKSEYTFIEALKKHLPMFTLIEE